jgi:[acyl-carrier-protein] S-malonyltransferase
MSFSEALPLVQKRGRYMQEALPSGVSGMAALLGLSREKVLEACRLSAQLGVVEPANYNAPDQIVVAGELDALRNACRIAKEFGAKRAIELPVSVSFHCSLLKNVETLLDEAMDMVTLESVKLPVVANVTADYVWTPQEIRLALIRQVSHPVLWQDSVERLAADGYDAFVEVGPGKSLTGLVKKILPNHWVHQAEDLESVNNVVTKFSRREDETYAATGR